MAKFQINKEVCIGCGSCVNLCPECFEIGDDGKSQVKEGECNCQADEAIGECPVRAISLVEEK